MNRIAYKKYFVRICTLCFMFFAVNTYAQTSSLRTNESVLVDSGLVLSTSILSDPQGLVYTEFGQDTYVVQRTSKLRFNGEILPPTIIEEPVYLKPPRGRMYEIVSFEVASDTLENLAFTDKFFTLVQRSRERQAALNGGTLESTKHAKAIIPLFQNYGYPSLWEYTGDEDDPWVRLGGRTETTKDDEIDLFVAHMNGTGIYVVFDENPAPNRVDTFIPYEEIQKAPEAPYTSVQPTFETPTTPETFAGDELFLDPSFGDEVNIPIDQFGNPIDTNTTINPISENPTTGSLGAFGVPADQFGIQGQFSSENLRAPQISPNSTQPSNPLNPDLNTPIAEPSGNIFLPKDTPNIPITETEIVDSASEEVIPQTQSTPPPTVSQQRVDELVQQRLLQGAPDVINTPLFENTQEESEPTEEGSIQSALLNESIARSAETSNNDVFLDETLFEDESYSSAPEGSLPQTGRTKSNTLWYVVLIGLVGIIGFALYRKKQPKQMELKIK